jgi:endo-1,4-beta-xylanase
MTIVGRIVFFLVTLSGVCMGTEAKTLRVAADDRGKLIGFAMTGGLGHDADIYKKIAAEEFNILVAENAMKFGLVCPKARGVYDFNDADAIVAFAQANGMKVRGHALVWHQQQPGWFSKDEWTKQEVADILHEHISTMVGRYKGKVFAWDVVNEAISDSNDANDIYRKTKYYEALGPEYIDMAFRWAKEADAGAKLFYNDYGADFGGLKFEKMYQMVAGMKKRGVPIDGVGLQMHVGLGAQGKGLELTKCIRRLGELGLEVHITELDVAVDLPADKTVFDNQAKVYGEITTVAMQEKACTAILLWGFTDKHSWIPWFSKGKQGAALIFDEDYHRKPAYEAMKKAMGK